MTEAEQFHRISELSKEFGVTTRTIRHYEDLGLLTPQRDGQTRLYTRSDRTRLKLILRGKRLGFSLEESRNIISLYKPTGNNSQQLRKLLDVIALQKQRLKDQLKDIETMMAELENAESNCLKSLKQSSKYSPK